MPIHRSKARRVANARSPSSSLLGPTTSARPGLVTPRHRLDLGVLLVLPCEAQNSLGEAAPVCEPCRPKVNSTRSVDRLRAGAGKEPADGGLGDSRVSSGACCCDVLMVERPTSDGLRGRIGARPSIRASHLRDEAGRNGIRRAPRVSIGWRSTSRRRLYWELRR